VSFGIDATLLNRCVEGCALSHQLMLETVSTLSDAQCREKSRLDGWTRGHLITHLARNAERHIYLFESAERGEIGDQYPGGMEQRNADIEVGALRPISELLSDLRTQTWNLEGQWARASAEAWQGQARRPGGAVIPMMDLVFLRWREVAIHLVDLDVNIDHSSWGEVYVNLELAHQHRVLSKRGISLPLEIDRYDPTVALAWMIGRLLIEELGEGPGFQL
jgi:maleylpyruvate isomerase